MDEVIEHVVRVEDVDADGTVFIEVLDKHDGVLQRQRFNALPLTLGTAYRSDFIVDADDDAAASHVSLRLERAEDGALELVAAEGSAKFWAPGGMTRRWRVDAEQAVSIAGARLRIRTPAYVPAADGKRRASMSHLNLGRFAWVWSLLLAIASFFALAWISDIDGGKVVNYISSGLGVLMLILIWSSVWALVSRLTGRASHFLTHLAVGALAFVALSVIDYLLDTAAFSFNMSTLQRYGYLLIGLTFGVAAWVHGRQIARVGRTTAAITAVLIGAVLFVSQAAGYYTLRGNIASAQTLTELRPPALRVTSGSTLDAFFSDAEALKEKSEQSRPEKPDGGDFGGANDD
jgi:hypothetical protein